MVGTLNSIGVTTSVPCTKENEVPFVDSLKVVYMPLVICTVYQANFPSLLINEALCKKGLFCYLIQLVRWLGGNFLTRNAT